LQGTDKEVFQRMFLPWQPNTAEKSKNGKKPSSISAATHQQATYCHPHTTRRSSNESQRLGLPWGGTMAAKKDKKARRLARKRKTQRSQQPSGQQILLKRARTSERFKDAKVLINPAGTEKMSEVILRFAEPLQDEYGVIPPNMIRFAILVWNASLLPEGAKKRAIKELVKAMPDADRDIRQGMLLAISMLLERKERYFSNNKRFIMDYQITESADRINLDVVSTMAEGYDPDPEAAK